MRVDPTFKCAQAAMALELPMFGLRDGGMCVGSTDMPYVYKTYGPSLACEDGSGGKDAMSAYRLTSRTTTEENLFTRVRLASVLGSPQKMFYGNDMLWVAGTHGGREAAMDGWVEDG